MMMIDDDDDWWLMIDNWWFSRRVRFRKIHYPGQVDIVCVRYRHGRMCLGWKMSLPGFDMTEARQSLVGFLGVCFFVDRDRTVQIAHAFQNVLCTVDDHDFLTTPLYYLVANRNVVSLHSFIHDTYITHILPSSYTYYSSPSQARVASLIDSFCCNVKSLIVENNSD